MKLLIFVMNKVDKLDKLLKEFGKNNITGATIISSKGMARELINSDNDGLFGSLRLLIDPNRSENKTIFMAIKDENLDLVVRTIESVVGSLDQPDTGILFTTPIDFIRGLKH